jgi:hypothetical protein
MRLRDFCDLLPLVTSKKKLQLALKSVCSRKPMLTRTSEYSGRNGHKKLLVDVTTFFPSGKRIVITSLNQS